MDVLVESNVNRQLPALTDTFGRGKIEVLPSARAASTPASASRWSTTS